MQHVAEKCLYAFVLFMSMIFGYKYGILHKSKGSCMTTTTFIPVFVREKECVWERSCVDVSELYQVMYLISEAKTTSSCVFQQYSRDDSTIGSKEESRQIKCESSPPTPRSLRLERVAAALAKSQSDTARQTFFYLFSYIYKSYFL